MPAVETSGVTECGNAVRAVVGNVVVGDKIVVASLWTDSFTEKGDSEGDGTVVASESSNDSSEDATVDVSLSVTS